MLVETYEVEQTTQAEPENFEAVKQLINECGLKAQEQFVNNETKAVFGFREMTPQELAIYNTLCPIKTKVKEFGGELIPLRVMEIIKRANETGFLTEIYVWHKGMRKEDPVLVGDLVEDGWRHTYYLLARWGEVLEPLEKLYEKAKEQLLNECRNKVEGFMAEIQSYNVRLKAIVDDYFAGRKIHRPDPQWSE